MHVATILHNYVPRPTGAGVPIMNWAVIKHLVEAGHRVSVFLLLNPPSDMQQRRTRDEHVAELCKLGVSVTLVPIPLEGASRWRTGIRLIRAAIKPTLADLYQTHVLAPTLKKLVDSANPDVLYMYSMASVVASQGIEGVPRMAAIVDLDHLVLRYRRAYADERNPINFGISALSQLASRILPNLTIELLEKCDSVVDHAANHASWLRDNGIPECLYFPNPVVDVVGSEWAARREEFAHSGKPKILMVGHMRGIATLSGLHLFADEILPALERTFGVDGFEVHVVGGDSIPDVLAKKFVRPSIKLRGYVEDVHREFLSCDVLLVPTPIELGFRTRIAEGFSFGCCVVAHSANALGIAELIHEDNVLLASDGIGLADQVIRTITDPDIRNRLGSNARSTYEEKINPDVICGEITAELERILNAQVAAK